MNQLITDFFAADHDRLDLLFAQSQQCLVNEPKTALRYFVIFKSGLEQHIRWEENQLFPMFERATNLFNMGPTYVMRLEHTHIKASLANIEQSLSDYLKTPDNALADTVLSQCTELTELLSQHNLKEENILYPAIDEALDSASVAKLFADMAI